MPRICDVIDAPIARPAASSFAELMRLPVDSRCIAVVRSLLASEDALVARSAAVLEAITVIVTLRGCRAAAAPEASDRR